MIIQEVILENYLCYYDVKHFAFGDGLNVILGENGEGKTKFFEAVEWLFKGNVPNVELLVSAKKLAEQAVGSTFRVRVSLTAIQDKEKKVVTRQFTVTKKADGCSCSRVTLEGIEEAASGERSQVDGERLVEQLFPSIIRRYSLFKGESALDIFDSPDALITLINNFSAAKYYDKYAEKGSFLRAEAEKAVEADTKLKTKQKAHYERLEAVINHLERERNRLQTLLRSTTENIEKTEAEIEDASRYVSNAEDLDRINKRIDALDEKIAKETSQQHDDFTTSLFDDRWILINFEGIHQEFAEKVNSQSQERRRLQSEFDKEVGIKIGERQERAKLLNDAIPLPVTVPSKAQMEEMLKDELCKVCNRPALKGSEAYVFMLSRLEDYINTQLPIVEPDEDEEVLFSDDYTSRLVTMASTHEDSLATIRTVQHTIKDVFELNETLKQSVDKHIVAKEEAEAERARVIGNSTKGEDSLQNVLKNYNQWQRSVVRLRGDEGQYQNELNQVEQELKERRREKDEIDIESGNSFLIKTRAIFRDICTIFKDTREAKFDEFVAMLQGKSNEVFQSINDGAFTGEIIFQRKPVGGKSAVTIELQENGRILHLPNQALLTSMHISILFAISKLAQERREEGFPMMFDAPTSSFGETKTTAFLNIISSSENQIILLLKDFLVKDKSGNLSVKEEFKSVKAKRAMWVILERPFDARNLETINSQVINL